MRHGKRGRHLNRKPSHRRSLFRNLARALFTHESIVTTTPKAKELRPFAEKLITLAKKAALVVAGASGKGEAEEKAARIAALHYRRQAMALLGPTHGTGVWDKNDENPTNDTVLKKLFREIGPRYAARPGGYTRIMKQHYRRLGDAGETSIIELLKANDTKIAKQPAPAAPVVAPAPAALEAAPAAT